MSKETKELADGMSGLLALLVESSGHVKEEQRAELRAQGFRTVKDIVAESKENGISMGPGRVRDLMRALEEKGKVEIHKGPDNGFWYREIK